MEARNKYTDRHVLLAFEKGKNKGKKDKNQNIQFAYPHPDLQHLTMLDLIENNGYEMEYYGYMLAKDVYYPTVN